jgi:hypothetical protein
MKFVCCGFIWAMILATSAHASSDSAWAELDKASAAACLKASGFLEPKVSAPVRFSDSVGFDARVVTGVYPQKHMKRAKGRMLCLYSRTGKSAEVQELLK